MADYRHIARQFAAKYGIDPDVFERQIDDESGFQTRVTSPAGAEGIAQFEPATAKSRGVDPWDPISALEGAAKLDRDLIKQTGSYRRGLAAYNAGPGNIKAGLGYADKILGGSNPKLGSSSRARSAASVSPGSTASPQAVPDLASIVQALSASTQPSPAAAQAPPVQGFAAHALTPGAYRAPVQTAAPAPKGPDPDQVLQAVAALTQAQPAATSTASSGGDTPGRPSSARPSSKGGVVNFGGKPVASWIAPILEQAKKAGWQGTVSSGYRSKAEQTQIYNSGVRPAAKPGTSNHEFTSFPGGAVDVTDAPQLAQILKKLGVTSLQYAGSKDAVHFSHPHNGGY